MKTTLLLFVGYTYEETSINEKSVVYNHSNEIPNKFAVDVKERQDRLPTMYWSCTTTELSKLLTSCLTAIKAKFIFSTVRLCMKGQGKICSGV